MNIMFQVVYFMFPELTVRNIIGQHQTSESGTKTLESKSLFRTHTLYDMIFISDKFCVTVLPVLGLKVGQYQIPQWKSTVMFILLNFTFGKSQHGKTALKRKTSLLTEEW